MSDKDHVAGLAIQIPENMLRQTIMAEVAKQLPNRDKIFEHVIKSAMNTDDRNSYGRKTVFEAAVEKMIQEVTKEMMKEWIEEHRAGIKEAFVKAMTRSKGKAIRALADKMVDGVTSVYVDRITLKLDDD